MSDQRSVVVDDLVLIVQPEVAIRHERIGVQRRAVLDVARNLLAQMMLPHVLHNSRPDARLTLLWRSKSPMTATLAREAAAAPEAQRLLFARAHVAGLSADVHLLDLDLTA